MKKEKAKIEKCGICKTNIYLNVDNYCQLIDFRGGKFQGEGFYHIKCYIDKLKGGQELNSMKQRAFNLLGKAEQMIGMEKEDTFKIK